MRHDFDPNQQRLLQELANEICNLSAVDLSMVMDAMPYQQTYVCKTTNFVSYLRGPPFNRNPHEAMQLAQKF